MSKAYDLISESLNEIITDLEENDGKNLKRETVSLKLENKFTKYMNKGERMFKSTEEIDEYIRNEKYMNNSNI